MIDNIPKVENIVGNSGREIPNQFVIHTNNGEIILDNTYWKYSPTTSKYRIKFLGEKTKETQKKINNGEYKISNLNWNKNLWNTEVNV